MEILVSDGVLTSERNVLTATAQVIIIINRDLKIHVYHKLQFEVSHLPFAVCVFSLLRFRCICKLAKL